MEHRDPGPEAAGRPVSALRELLNGWDPIGVVDEQVYDEYDCLITPILDLLNEGAEPPELTAFLRRELVEHFGLSSGLNAEQKIETLARGAVRLREPE